MERVWDYPRPPAVRPCDRRVRVEWAGEVLADSTEALRVLETSHPPAGYEALRDHVAFYPGRVDAAWLGDERAQAQPGDFYGGSPQPDNGSCVYTNNLGAAAGAPLAQTGDIPTSATELATVISKVLSATGAAKVEHHARGLSQRRAVMRQRNMAGVISDHALESLWRHGFAVAYRMLGSVTEAEDVTQEALLRLTRQEDVIDEPAAWMTTVTTRLAINVLRSARVRRESYVGPWLPEPLVEDPAPGPASRAELADSLSLALLVVLERLTPTERAAYLLREVFAYEYAQIAEIIDQTEVNARQLVTRARKHLDANRPRFDADEEMRDELLERFMTAAEHGELEDLEALLAKDAVLYADSGGKVMAPPEPLVGAALIARFMAFVSQARPRSELFEIRRVRVNGQPGRLFLGPAEPQIGDAGRSATAEALALVRAGDVDARALEALVRRARADDADASHRPTPSQPSQPRVWSVLTVDVSDGRIQTVRVVRNPDKLAHL